MASAGAYALASTSGVVAFRAMRRRPARSRMARGRNALLTWWAAAASVTALLALQWLLLAIGAPSALSATVAIASAAAFATLLAALAYYAWFLYTGRTLPILVVIGTAVTYYVLAVWSIVTAPAQLVASESVITVLARQGSAGRAVLALLTAVPVLSVLPLAIVAFRSTNGERRRAGLVAGGVLCASAIPLASSLLPVLSTRGATAIGIAAGALAVLWAYLPRASGHGEQ